MRRAHVEERITGKVARRKKLSTCGVWKWKGGRTGFSIGVGKIKEMLEMTGRGWGPDNWLDRGKEAWELPRTNVQSKH